MDAEARLRRREQARRRTRRQRQIALAALLGVLALAGLAIALTGGGEEKDDGDREARAADAEARPELPRGGRRIFPEFEVVAFYGAPQSRELGALGIGTPAQAARRLRKQARPYRRSGRRVLPAFELIAVIAAHSPGDDGLYRNRQPTQVIRRYLEAARKARALLILDVQPGHADFMDEVRELEPFLEQPDVGLALDPEWHTPGQEPGTVIGSTDAATVNEVSAYLAEIVRREQLPQKLLVVHQFTQDMIRDRAQIERRPGLAITINVDGFGHRAVKVAKYEEFTSLPGRFHEGFKLFYEEDTNLMKPLDVLRMRPRPELVVYE